MLHMIFDVESIGLHGEGYAVGFVVCDSHITPVGEGMFACPPAAARGTWQNHLWVRNLEYSLPCDCETPKEVRTKFWEAWQHWGNLFDGNSLYLWADCGWPVEARFLLACVEDDPVNREWKGPYPLMDIAPLLSKSGIHPTSTFYRLPNELPIHNPLNDARQSARILRWVLRPGTEQPPVIEEVTK